MELSKITAKTLTSRIYNLLYHTIHWLVKLKHFMYHKEKKTFLKWQHSEAFKNGFMKKKF